MDFSYVHIRYFIGYVYHICLQDTIQSTLSLCLLCQAMLLPMPLRPLLLTTRSGFNVLMLFPHGGYCIFGFSPTFTHFHPFSQFFLLIFTMDSHTLVWAFALG